MVKAYGEPFLASFPKENGQFRGGDLNKINKDVQLVILSYNTAEKEHYVHNITTRLH